METGGAASKKSVQLQVEPEPSNNFIFHNADGDDDEELRTDTLYEATDLREYIARRVETDDISTIKSFLREEDYDFFKFEDPCALFERTCFSIALSDVTEVDRVVAVAFFDDKPVNPDLKTYAKNWKSSARLLHSTPLNTFYLHLFAASPEVNAEQLVTEIVCYAFSACHHLQLIIVELPDKRVPNPFSFSKLVVKKSINLNHRIRKRIIIYDKDLLLPPVKIREGREHDLDDLSPLLPLDEQTISREFGKPALSDLIATCDRNNQTMVAEWNIEAKGIIAVSTDIDYAMLNKFYHLEPFHGLHKPHFKDQIELDHERVRHSGDVPVEEILKTAKGAMESLNVKRRKGVAEKLPYSVESFRGLEECGGGDYESDISGGEQVGDERTHQYGVKVSEDILAYKLRSESVLGDAKVSISDCVAGLRSCARKEAAKMLLEGEEAGEDDEEEEEEEEGSLEEEEENVPQVRPSEEWEKKQLSEFYDEFLGEEEEEEEEEEQLELLYKPNSKSEESLLEMEGGLEEEDEAEGDAVEEVETVAEVKAVEVELDIFDLAEVKVEEVEVEEEEGEEEEDGEEEGEEEEGESGEVEDGEGESGEAEVGEYEADDDKTGEDETGEEKTGEDETGEEKTGEDEVGEEGDNEEEEEVDDDESTLLESTLQGSTESETQLGSVTSPSSTEYTTTTLDQESKDILEEEEEDEEEEEEEEEERKPKLKPSGLLTLPTSTVASSNITVGFFQNRDALMKRWSDDTIFLGKVGTQRNFEEKVELMKKVWEVYLFMKEEGLSFEAAKMYLGTHEMEVLQEADVLTKGNLLRFLTVLLPDDKKYPFERPLKVKLPVYFGLPNALAIKLFNMEKKFSLRTLDMFRAIFKCFPNREYLIATLPQGSKEPAWLDHFVRVVPRRQSPYPKELFVLHKAYLSSVVKVRRANIGDIPQVIRLVSTLKDNCRILEDFKRAVCCKTQNAFVAFVKNHPNKPVVGMAVASDELTVQNYHVNYDLDKHIYFFLHQPKDHAYVHHLILYPIFQRYSRLLMKEVMRMMEKTTLFQRLYPEFAVNEFTQHQTVLNNLDDWIPLTPRKRVHYDHLNFTEDSYDVARRPPDFVLDYKDPFAVIHFAKKFSFDQKVSMNKRVVFVGASETCLSCIEKMIGSSFKGYKRVTIIDPFGIPGQLPPEQARDEFFGVKKGGKSMSFESNAEWVQRMGIRSWVTVVLGWVTKIVRDKKYVMVNDESVVPYDILVLTPGRQFLRPDCSEPEINDPNFIQFKKKTSLTAAISDKHSEFQRDKPKPKNVFTVNTEIEADIALTFIRRYTPFMKRKKFLVFGGGLRAYACVKALLVFGIQPNRIILIIPPGHEVEWEVKTGYILTDTVKVPVEEEMKKMGICVLENYEFSHWDVCSISGLVKRTHFTSSVENDARISIPTFALFSYRFRRVNDHIVSALADAYLLFQEGIIIDEKFLTNDPDIYAAGPASVYQKILLANHQNHVFFQAEEVGQQLADFLVERTGTEGGGSSNLHSLDVIRCQRPFVRSVVLVGGWHYLYFRSPGAPLHKRCIDPYGSCDEACECSTEVVTGSVDAEEDELQRYFKIRLDEQSRVVGVECMSKHPFSASNLIGLYGQHEVLLNKMMERLEKGETKDLFSHFCQPWYGVFCLDQWEGFLQELRDIYSVHDIGDGDRIGDFIRDFISNLSNADSMQVDSNIIRNIWDRSGLKERVELRFLDFLKAHRLSLPMYARNDYVEDLLEERTTSTLYYPEITQF